MNKAEKISLFEDVFLKLDREFELKRHGFLNSEYYKAQTEALKAIQDIHDRNLFKDFSVWYLKRIEEEDEYEEHFG